MHSYKINLINKKMIQIKIKINHSHLKLTSLINSLKRKLIKLIKNLMLMNLIKMLIKKVRKRRTRM